MDPSNPIILYDIASAPPVTCFAPNPWKTRYALNFKRAHYKTEWVELPDVTQDQSTGEINGDSFDIAVYLDKLDTDTPSLFPPSTLSLQAAFNTQVDPIFSQFATLFMHGLPFNPETAELSQADFERRAGMKWDDMNLRGKEREDSLVAMKAALEPLAKLYKLRDGLFLEGDMPIYADFIVGAWLAYLKVTLKEWEDLRTWHDGLWGRIHQALEKYAEVR